MKTCKELADLGLKMSQPDRPNRKMIGFEMQPLVEALGIEGGVVRLVIEVDVGKPVMVYFTRYLEESMMEKVVNCFKEKREVSEVTTVECESVVVNENEVVIIPKKEVE